MVYRVITWNRRGARLGTKVASKGTQGAKKVENHEKTVLTPPPDAVLHGEFDFEVPGSQNVAKNMKKAGFLTPPRGGSPGDHMNPP